MSEDEAKPIEAESAAPEPAPAPKKKKRGKFRIFAWLLMLIVLAGIGGAGYLAIQHPEQLQSLFHRFMAQVHTRSPAKPVSAPTTPAPAITTAPPVAAPQPATPPAPTTVAPQSLYTSTPTAPSGPNRAASPELLTAIRQLQHQLQQVETDNAEVRKALAEQQRMDLKSRLRLIADPATHLKETSLLWQDVALSPVITDAQRQQAVSLADAANQALTENQLWLHRLDAFIAQTGNSEAGADVIPHFSHPWLAWLAGQFHLRPAVGPADKGNAALHGKLVQIRSDMALETWPDAKTWQPVRAQLVLIATAAAKPGSGTAPVSLGLPNNFTAMRQAVANLHATAQQWLGNAP